FLPGGAQGGVSWLALACPQLVPTPPCGGSFRMYGHTIRNSVKPACQGLFFTNGARLLRQDEKRGLESVLGVVDVAQRAQAEAQDHWPMPPHQLSKGGVVAIVQEGAEQCTVGLLLGPSLDGQAADVPEDEVKLSSGHRNVSPHCVRCLSYSARRGANLTTPR